MRRRRSRGRRRTSRVRRRRGAAGWPRGCDFHRRDRGLRPRNSGCCYCCRDGGDDSRNGLTYRDYGDATTPSRVGNQATWGAGTVTPGATALGAQISIVDYGQGATDWRDLWIR